MELQSTASYGFTQIDYHEKSESKWGESLCKTKEKRGAQLPNIIHT